MSFPEVITTMNKNTNQIEVDLRTQIYETAEMKLTHLDTSKSNILIEVGICNGLIIFDLEEKE